ncbi:MAG: hypothetical protein Q8S15_02055 [Erysipelotrichaceae bacterium]|nr:hypothetical protein [Erysipelotrichaceae bacterium]MDP3304848.1 hypothetical protein [Erysipelotrichaceae bacterium]
MGTTLSSVSIFTTESIDESYGIFRSFSKDWQTLLPPKEPKDFMTLQRDTRKLSKSISAPVLLFGMFDSDEILLEVYIAGKCISRINPYIKNKGVFNIPSLFGYPNSGYKRRLSNIISCSDAELLTELLEEYLGVSLLIFPEVLKENPELLRKIRSEEKYNAYQAEEKKLRGKNANVRIKLMETIPGKLFRKRFMDTSQLAPSYFLFGFDSPESQHFKGNLRAVRFNHGRLEPVEESDIPRVSFTDQTDEIFKFAESYPRVSVIMSDSSPISFRGKQLYMPQGYYPFAFNSQGQLLISNLINGIMVMDSEGKVIAKCSMKGCPMAYSDDYILTSGNTSEYAYVYVPGECLRIYRLEYGEST